MQANMNNVPLARLATDAKWVFILSHFALRPYYSTILMHLTLRVDENGSRQGLSEIIDDWGLGACQVPVFKLENEEYGITN